MNRYVDEDRLLASLSAALRAEGIRGDAAANVRARVGKYLARAPRLPDLVSRKAAATILGVQSPNIARFAEQGRMPEPVPVEGSAPVYLRSEVEAFRDQRAAEEEARRKKRLAREERARPERAKPGRKAPTREKVTR